MPHIAVILTLKNGELFYLIKEVVENRLLLLSLKKTPRGIWFQILKKYVSTLVLKSGQCLVAHGVRLLLSSTQSPIPKSVLLFSCAEFLCVGKKKLIGSTRKVAPKFSLICGRSI